MRQAEVDVGTKKSRGREGKGMLKAATYMCCGMQLCNGAYWYLLLEPPPTVENSAAND